MLEQLQWVLDCTFKAFACPKFSKSDNAISPFDDVSNNYQFSMVAVLVVFSNDGNISYVRVRHLPPQSVAVVVSIPGVIVTFKISMKHAFPS